jgi:hypothetical protein
VASTTAWSAGAAVTVAAAAGYGLYSLSLGRDTAGIGGAHGTSVDDHASRRCVCRRRSCWRGSSGRGGWISVNQVAQVLLSGTDSSSSENCSPEVVVTYACTASVDAARQSAADTETALPLSEMRTAPTRTALRRVEAWLR